MESVQIDLKTACRTCKCESWEMKPLYYRDPESSKEDPRLDEMLMTCTSVKVSSEDGLPKLICRSCYVQLKNAFLFKTQCEKTDLFLRDYQRWLKNQERATGDVELADNLADDTSMLDKTGDKNKDYIEVVDNNLTIYKCKTCSKVFYTLEGLKCHKKMHISKAFKCKQCDRSYTKLDHLQKHELLHARCKKHVCKICNKTLPTQVRLKRHLMIHSKEKPHDCPNCNSRFKLVENLRTHTKSCKSKKVFVCDICNEEFTHKDTMEKHKREHSNAQPALVTLDNTSNLEDHCIKIEFDDTINAEDLSHGDGIGAFYKAMEPEVEMLENSDEQKNINVAEIIEEAYIEPDTSEMLIDKVKIEEEMITGNEIGAVRDDELLNAINGNDYSCDNNAYSESVPLKSATTKSENKRLARNKFGRPRGRPSPKDKSNSEAYPTSTTYECPQCKLIFNELNVFERHAEQHGLKMYECETCHKKFSRCKNLKIHESSHLKTKPFTCTLCNKRFSKRNLLNKHVKLHTNKDVFNCEICQVVFSEEESLKKHKEFTHNITDKSEVTEIFQTPYEEETFQCTTCEKTFSSKSELTEHMKSHKNRPKKVLCTECGQRCGKHDLETHMRRHRGEKPFKCNFCDKGFTRKSDVIVHERYHTGEKTHLCVICGKAFGRPYNLTVHMRTHTGEKPYHCTYCKAAFSQSCDLKTHIRRHTGERFKCEICPETFLMGYHLTQHKRVVHGIISSRSRLQATNTLNQGEYVSIDSPPAPVQAVSVSKTDTNNSR